MYPAAEALGGKVLFIKYAYMGLEPLYCLNNDFINHLLWGKLTLVCVYAIFNLSIKINNISNIQT